MNIDFKRLFLPSKIAVVGASSNPEKLGGVVMNNLTKGKYQGIIFPVNPKGGEMLGHPVVTSIDKLPDDLRTAITLRELDGLSYEEIADVMECPIGTVRSRIFRAREAIDKQLSPLLEE